MKAKTLLLSLFLVAGSFLQLGFGSGQNIEWGAPMAVGQGEAKTFVTLDATGKLETVGVYLTDAALSGLPSDVIEAETVLRFPEAAKTVGLNHFALDWNPHGHEPMGVYDVAHFDFHFYMISKEDRALIQAGNCTSAEDNRVPSPPGMVPVSCLVFEDAMQPLPADQLPKDYIMTPSVVPGMGNHLVDASSPELQGKLFTHTWIYGAYKGKITFLEPMMTRDFLLTHENVCQAIKSPVALAQAGWLPTSYCVRYLPDEGAITVSLESFKQFQASKNLTTS